VPKEILSIVALALLCAPAAVFAGAEENRMATEDRIPTERGELVIRPVEHATFVMEWDGKTIYVDPVGGAEAFEAFPPPDLILVTDIHGDHFDAETIEGVAKDTTEIVASAEVARGLPSSFGDRVVVLANGEKTDRVGMGIEAVPMYNLTSERLRFHTKGRGNGYVLKVGDKRIYNSGDTEDIPEMRELRSIDAAFVCMNLPYTMDVEQAVRAVREFRPKIVYPFHYRGAGGEKSDVELFKALVEEQGDIEVRLLQWYP
jgi:L-ascorbate metabolism protein UlaG (beta-lactamase superfamily)